MKMAQWIATGRTGAIVAAAAISAPALAQDVPAQPTNDVNIAGGDRLTIGVGPSWSPTYIGSRHSVLLPTFAAQGEVSGYSFNTQGPSLTVDVVRDDGQPGWKIQAGPTINVRVDRTSRIRDAAVEKLGKLGTAWEPGVWAGIQRTGVVTSPYDTLSFNVTWQRDVSGTYNGSVLSPSLSYGTPLSHRDYVSLSAGADYVGRRFGAYYYDVSDAGSAASGLRAYDAAGRNGWKDWNLSLLAAHAIRGDLTHGLGVFATFGYSRLLGVYARSPIVADVGDPGQLAGAIGFSLTL